MALVINDRVKETSTTSGQGTLNLDGASQDFITFVEGIGTGKQTYYAIVETGNNLFEIGIGTVTDATPALGTGAPVGPTAVSIEPLP